MSIEAMKLAQAALESCAPADTSSGHVICPSFDEKLVDRAYASLSTAIQQAEAAASGPVARVDYSERGNIAWLFGQQLPDGTELFKHPAPGVPEDVAQDAQRLNELEALVQSKGTHGLSFDYCKHVEDGYVVEKGFRVMWRHHLGERKPTLREAIDAASPAQKGGE